MAFEIIICKRSGDIFYFQCVCVQHEGSYNEWFGNYDTLTYE